MLQTIKTIFLLGLIMIATGFAIIPQVQATGLDEPAAVVQQYLDSLVSGDTRDLASLMDGRMLESNRHLVQKPDSYAIFLKKHYAGVQTHVEEITSVDGKQHARVRFDFPAQDASEIVLILDQLNGQWKIIDELY